MKPNEIIGAIGGALLVLAYVLMVRGDVVSTSLTYNTLMLLGVTGIGINVWVQRAWPTVALEVIFGAVAVWAIVKEVQAWL